MLFFCLNLTENPQGNGDISPSRHSKAAAKVRAVGSTLSNGIVNKHDGLSNGTTSTNAKVRDILSPS